MPRNRYGDEWDGQTVTTNWSPSPRRMSEADKAPFRPSRQVSAKTTPNPEGEWSGLINSDTVSVKTSGALGRGERGAKVMARVKLPFAAPTAPGKGAAASTAKTSQDKQDDSDDDDDEE